MSKKTFSKLLSEKFQISRKKAEDLIKNKKVLLNDNIESRPYLVVQEKDIISLNEPIEKKVNIILFHKPKGCITSRSDEKNRTIVYDYLPKKFKIIIILVD
jgi:23S rRNA pseudouridine2605 synthase